MLSVITMNDVMPNVVDNPFMLNVVTLRVFILRIVILSVVMLSVLAP
jgi:hypothetical protein